MNYLNALPGRRALLDAIGRWEAYRERRQRAGALSPAEARQIADTLRALRGQLGGQERWGSEAA